MVNDEVHNNIPNRIVEHDTMIYEQSGSSTEYADSSTINYTDVYQSIDNDFQSCEYDHNLYYIYYLLFIVLY